MAAGYSRHSAQELARHEHALEPGLAEDSYAPDAENSGHAELAEQSSRIHRAYISALIILGAILAVSFVALDRNLQTQARYNSLITKSASQRAMLSSTFTRTNDLKEAVRADRPNLRMQRQIRQRLREDISELEGNHAEVLALISELDASSAAAEIRSIYFDAPHALSTRQSEYINRIQNILALSPKELTATMRLWVPIDAATAGQGMLAIGHRAAATQIQKSLFSHMTQLRQVHRALTALIVVVMLLEAFLIFRPLVSGLKRTLNRVMQAQQRLDYMAFHDMPTGLPNRRGLSRLADSTLSGNDSALLLSVEIDNVSQLREKLGPDSDEDLMNRFALRLKPLLPARATIARTGDDEISILLPAIEQFSQHGVVGSIVKTARSAMHIRDIPVQPKVSAGVALRPADGLTTDDLLSKARIARRSSGLSTTGVAEYNAELAEAAAMEELIADEIRAGLDTDQFVPHYQLKFDANDGRIRGMEALARWNHPERGLVSPGQFIPVAEKTGLIIPMTWRILEQITSDYLAWREEGLRLGRVAFNASEAVLLHDDLLPRLEAMIDQLGEMVPPIEIEVTENIALSDNQQNLQWILSRIRGLGISVALDDFGTGYASLTHLLDLEIDVIKIDRSFVSGMVDNKPKRFVVESIVAMGASLKKVIVAEGVETAQEANALRDIGCDVFQGFYFARPEPAEIVLEKARAVKPVSAAQSA